MELYDYEKEHLAALRPHLAECTLFLKRNGDFPLEKAGKIAAFGNGVRRTVKGGTGSGEVNSRYFVTVEQGLQEAGFQLTTKSWLDEYDKIYAENRKQFFQNLRAEAKKAKVNAIMYSMGKIMPEPDYDLPLNGEGEAAVYVLSRISGEGSDRNPIPGCIKLSATEKKNITALNKQYSKFMLVLNVGGPVDLSELDEVKNILVLSQLGVDTGSVLADILLGKENPSGKLATTWAKWEDYSCIGQFGEHNDTRYKEGVYVGYRYFDSVGIKALYPFGLGLSYTDFEIRTEGVTTDGTKVNVRATATNTGKFPGKETVQVYVSSPDGKLDKPYQALAGFKKTGVVNPGSHEEVAVSFDMKDLVSYDEETASYILKKGDYIVRVGNSSVHTEAACILRLAETVTVLKARNVLGKPDFKDWQPEARKAAEVRSGIPVHNLSASLFESRAVIYDRPAEVDDAVKNLTNEQLAYANIGAFNPKGGLLSIIGNASTNVAGAAGETTEMLKEQGFPSAIMADGPAGLRLSQRFYRDSKGLHILGEGSFPESILELMPGPMRWVSGLLGGKSKLPKGCVEENQYCTALPIGTAIAQSFNTEFAEKCGDIVGAEMERFGVHFWLAPALNIHRSIRCGRNFEYYSEDPLISGKMAAAITLGVQKHPGCATTIKHFCVNNQEYNRSGNNSVVSERAMREIYLRGFGICVREAQPHAVMTSYNLLNGCHTAECRGLSQSILRDEFGYEGVIMTDWVVGGSAMDSKQNTHASVRPRLVAKAGGDLFMPGGKAEYEDLLKGIAEGDLTREQLLINASRVYRMVRRLAGKE